MLPVPSSRWKTLASLVLIGLSASASAQQASSVHVLGLVIDAQTGTPLRRARVTPNVTAGLSSPVFSDNDGRFSMELTGAVTVRVAKAGYAEQTVSVTKPTGTDAADVRVAMQRGAAITGRVVDETGAPVEGISIGARSTEPNQGRSTFQRVARTDDLGEFRIAGLSEGEFVVEDEPARAATTRVRVRPGEGVAVGDIVVRARAVRRASVAVDPNAAGGASVGGRVRDAKGRPQLVDVSLIQPDTQRQRLIARTDAQGRFAFEHVPPATYFAEIEQAPTRKVRFGQRSAGQPGTPIEVREGKSISNIDFVLSGAVAITGSVWDEYGEPVEGANVRVLQLRRVGDRVAAVAADGTRGHSSDDRGRYRVAGLLPGRYLVVADGDPSLVRVGDARNTTGYAPVFYPNAADVTYAQPVTVGQADVSGIDIAFRGEPAARVSGSVVDSSGRPARTFVTLGVSQRSGAMMLEPRMAPPLTEGAFVFESVAPGDYVIQATAPGPPASDGVLTTEFGMQYVTVTGGEPVQVVLKTSPGVRLRGRVTVDGQPSARPPILDVIPLGIDADQSMLRIDSSLGMPLDDDGSFEVSVTGPRRFVVLSPLDGWYLKAARVHGVDALDSPFDVTGDGRAAVDDVALVVSPAAATVSGKVLGSAGDVRTDCAVVLFSTDSSKWYRQSQALRLERPAQSGEFKIGSLPPGSYYLLAVSDLNDLVTSGDWQDPATLDRVRSSATEISLNESEARSVTLRLKVAP